jgi:hypothetical protein
MLDPGLVECWMLVNISQGLILATWTFRRKRLRHITARHGPRCRPTHLTLVIENSVYIRS